MKSIVNPFAALTAALILAGCASSGGVSGSGVSGTEPQASYDTGTATGAYPYEEGQAPAGQAYGGYAGAGPVSSGRVIYFDFDSAEVRPDGRPVVETNARYLLDNGAVTVVLEGHGDERGTREYNIGLGERRADAVRRLMSAYGIAPQRIRVVSYGEERPAVAGHDETSYAQNRRVEIIYY